MNNSRNLFEGLPPPAECLAILVGCANLTIFGLGTLANPSEWAKGYGVPLISPTEEEPSTQFTAENVERTQTALVAAIAARNVQNGILVLTLACYVRDRRVLGIATLANVVTAAADAVIARTYGVQSAVFGHVVGVVNALAIGGALLHWERSDPWW